MIYIIYLQRFTSVHLKHKFDLIYVNLYNLHLYLLIHLLYVLYSAGISAIEKQFYYYMCLVLVEGDCVWALSGCSVRYSTFNDN